jgi:hypothetical protein
MISGFSGRDLCSVFFVTSEARSAVVFPEGALAPLRAHWKSHSPLAIAMTREVWGIGGGAIANVEGLAATDKHNAPRQFHPFRHCEARSAVAIQWARSALMGVLNCHGPYGPRNDEMVVRLAHCFVLR